MKMSKQHYQILKSAIVATIENHRQQVTDHRAKVNDVRFRWDLLWASKNTLPSPYWLQDELYPYLNDDHIDTALRSIVKEVL